MISSRKALILVAAIFLLALGLPSGGIVPAASAQIFVTSAVPDTADQGTVGLDVTIGGKGFKRGAKAAFLLAGTSDTAGVTVRATKFVSDAVVVATIDVTAAAIAAKFDIQVTNSDGRTGKGTELFTVLKRVKAWDGELSAVFDATYGNKVLGDAQGTYASPAMQQDGIVRFDPTYGNVAVVFAVSANRSLTFEFDLLNNVRNAVSGGQVKCYEWGSNTPWGSEPAPAWFPGRLDAAWFLIRTEALVTYSLVDGVPVWASTGTPFNARDMAIGTSAIVGLNLTFKDAAFREYWVSLNEEHWGGKDLPLVSGFAKVTRYSADTWVLEPIGADEARPVGIANQANVIAYWPGVKRLHGGGNCDLGDWLMPFRMTLTAVR